MVMNACKFITNALVNLANACKRLTSETTTQHMCGKSHINPLPMFHFVTYSLATTDILCECYECLPMPLRILRMPLRMLATACDCLRKCCETNENMLSWRILGACS
jgi:hypothetical protein